MADLVALHREQNGNKIPAMTTEDPTLTDLQEAGYFWLRAQCPGCGYVTMWPWQVLFREQHIPPTTHLSAMRASTLMSCRRCDPPADPILEPARMEQGRYRNGRR